jgi:hypothetical protein
MGPQLLRCSYIAARRRRRRRRSMRYFHRRKKSLQDHLPYHYCRRYAFFKKKREE